MLSRPSFLELLQVGGWVTQKGILYWG